VSVEQSFEELYEQTYWSVLRYFARRVPGDEDHVRDLAAEVYLVAWRRRHALPSEPLPWLYGTARHVLSNDRRSTTRRRQLAQRLGHDPTGPAHEGHTGDHPDDHPHAWVHAALEQLSESDQEVLRLAAWEELTTDQMALALRCSRSAAAMRLHRARERLRAVLDRDPRLTETLRRSR
jgi:RNA polymerase sigma-70 factor (ECF subfamily)